MPPNPARQAAMAQKRAEFENDPALREAAESAGRVVLDSYDIPNETGPARNPGPTRPAPSRATSSFRGGSGGGSSFKANTGRKGALPPPDYDIKLFNYADGGKVTPVGRDATRGQFRTGGPLKQPDFAAGGGVLNKKSSNK